MWSTGTIQDQTFAINEIGPTVTQDFTLAKLAILTWRYLYLLKINSYDQKLTL